MNSKRRPSEYHLRPCPQCGFPDSMGASQYARRMEEDRMQYESLRRAVQGMIEAGASPKEVTAEIMWRLEIRTRPMPSYRELERVSPYEAQRMVPRIHPEWGMGEYRRGN